jgi:3'-5' exoribonuclease
MAANPDQPPHPLLLCDWRDGASVDAVLLVREVERRQKRDGASFLRLVLGDRSGTVPAVMWTPDQAGDAASPGVPAWIAGRLTEHPRYGRQVTVTTLREPRPQEIDWDSLLEGPSRPIGRIEIELAALLDSIRDPYLAELVERLLGHDTATGQRFRVAPAAKFNHHAYRHGLLEHSVDVAHGVSAVSSVFGLNRDIAVCGALLHDIGKLDAYEGEVGAIDLTDVGKLIGEIPLGYYRVRREIECIDRFPDEAAQHLLHIVLSHHGRLDYGSPVVPSTREATLVHAIDELSGLMGAYDRLEKETRDGDRWSRFDRVLETSAFLSRGEATASLEGSTCP